MKIAEDQKIIDKIVGSGPKTSQIPLTEMKQDEAEKNIKYIAEGSPAMEALLWELWRNDIESYAGGSGSKTYHEKDPVGSKKQPKHGNLAVRFDASRQQEIAKWVRQVNSDDLKNMMHVNIGYGENGADIMFKDNHAEPASQTDEQREAFFTRLHTMFNKSQSKLSIPSFKRNNDGVRLHDAVMAVPTKKVAGMRAELYYGGEGSKRNMLDLATENGRTNFEYSHTELDKDGIINMVSRAEVIQEREFERQKKAAREAEGMSEGI
jgi:hypothetical protein